MDEITETKMSWMAGLVPMTSASVIKEGDPIPVIEFPRIELYEAIEQPNQQEQNMSEGHAFQATVNTNQSVAIQQTYNLQNDLFDEVEKIISFVKDDQGHDPRWLAIFTTHIEEGFMALRKCIAQPKGRVKKS